MVEAIHLPVEMNDADGQSERDDGAVPPDDVAGVHLLVCMHLLLSASVAQG